MDGDCTSDVFRSYPKTGFAISPEACLWVSLQKPDLFAKRKDGQPPNAAHDSRGVDVIGELKVTNNNKNDTSPDRPICTRYFLLS